MNKQGVFYIILIFLFCVCDKKERSVNDNESKPVEKTTTVEPLSKKEHFEELLPFTFYKGYYDIGSTLVLDTNNTFYYSGGSSLWRSVVEGTYQIKDNAIILKDTSGYVFEFGEHHPYNKAMTNLDTDTLYLWEVTQSLYLMDYPQEAKAKFAYDDAWRDKFVRPKLKIVAKDEKELSLAEYFSPVNIGAVSLLDSVHIQDSKK